MGSHTVKMFPGMSFGVTHSKDKEPDKIQFKLHNHDDLYEIVLLLDGDCEFYVEGNTYKLKPMDIVFTRPFELHHMVCLSKRTYDRIIIYIRTDYFKKNNCEQFLDIFDNRKLGSNNLIPYDISSPAAAECIKRIREYCVENAYEVAEKVIYEFLHLINRRKNTSPDFHPKNDLIRRMIMYINDHLIENINLDTLSEKFYITKQYMCTVFKENTGYTINQYINYKRVLLAQELRRGGQSFLQASLDSGFNNYSNFYRNYVKYIGSSPRETKGAAAK